jgi:hypothetical protein
MLWSVTVDEIEQEVKTVELVFFSCGGLTSVETLCIKTTFESF